MENQRAKTNEEKAEVLQRILKVWQETFPSLRLGQLLLNLVDVEPQLWVIEDKAIVERLEIWAEEYKKKDKKI